MTMKYYYLTLADGSRFVSLPVRTSDPYYNFKEVREEGARRLSEEYGCTSHPRDLRLVSEVRFKNKLEFDYFLANKKVEEK